MKKDMFKGVLALFASFFIVGMVFSAASAGGFYTNGFPAATGTTGNETIPADTNLPAGQNPQTESITISQLQQATSADSAFQTAANTTAFTATTAQVTGNFTGGFDVFTLTGTLGAGANMTTPTAAAWIASMPMIKNGGSYTLRIVNSSGGAFSWTVVGGTGVTVTGTATVAQNTFRDYIVTFNTVAGTVGLQNVGSGTN